VATDLGCSWNQTLEDLKGEKEQTCEREVRKIIWTIHQEGHVVEINTHQRIGHREIRGEYKSKFVKGEFVK
jgi:hypothetical protein